MYIYIYKKPAMIERSRKLINQATDAVTATSLLQSGQMFSGVGFPSVTFLLGIISRGLKGWGKGNKQYTR